LRDSSYACPSGNLLSSPPLQAGSSRYINRRYSWEVRIYNEDEEDIGGYVPDEVKILGIGIEAEELDPVS